MIARYRSVDLDGGLPRGGDALERRPRHRSGEDARPVHGRPDEPLAALPDARLPGLGAVGLLPGERRLRLPRPAPGWDGAHGVAAGADARASAASRRAAVHRGRRSTLVAAGVGPGGSHPNLRRCRLVAVRHVQLCRGHGRSRGPRRERSLPRGACASQRRARRVLRTRRVPGEGDAVRALRSGARPEPLRRQPRSAALWRGRLERRHEPGRRRRQGGERLARLVPSRHALRASLPWQRPGASRRAPRPGGSMPTACGNRWSERAGTATGIGGATSTTEHRSARLRATNAGSIRSRSRGA